MFLGFETMVIATKSSLKENIDEIYVWNFILSIGYLEGFQIAFPKFSAF